jgi:TP53 regulating kinase and related kinases
LTSHGVSRTPSGQILYRGAEADIIRGEWQGVDVVYKERKPLRYRLAALDDSIRRQRTIHEAEMIHLARGAGVATPHLLDVDVSGSTLVMEFVEGERLKDIVDVLEGGELELLFSDFGRDVAKLHGAGIMHGDLTTANVVRKGRKLVFLDFGLALRTSRLEDHAVDLRLIKETLVGAHPSASARALDAFDRGYAAIAGPTRAKAVKKQLRNIERRGRYARVT